MGWGNPAVSWSEMERILAGKPARSGSAPGGGADGESAPQVDGPGTLHPADVGTVPVRGRPSRDVPHPGDGGDSPAWSRTRAPYRPPSGSVAGSATPATGSVPLSTTTGGAVVTASGQ